jgi:hypothetical protein
MLVLLLLSHLAAQQPVLRTPLIPVSIGLQVPRLDAEEMMVYLAHQARTESLPDAAATGMEGHQVCASWLHNCFMTGLHGQRDIGPLHSFSNGQQGQCVFTMQALMYHLTGGNAREMRKFGTGLLY